MVEWLQLYYIELQEYLQDGQQGHLLRGSLQLNENKPCIPNILTNLSHLFQWPLQKVISTIKFHHGAENLLVNCP
jgi:hypothetical protein